MEKGDDNKYKSAKIAEFNIGASNLTFFRQVNWPNGKQPVSSCGPTCKPGYVYSYGKNTCCWRCLQCSPNEITINDTHCAACPESQWPDITFSRCEPIAAEIIPWNDPLAIVMRVLGILGTVVCFVVFFLYVKVRLLLLKPKNNSRISDLF